MTFIPRMSQGRKLTFLGRRQLATDIFFSVAKWENVGDQLSNSGRQCKMFSRIGDQESAISDPGMHEFTTVTALFGSYTKLYIKWQVKEKLQYLNTLFTTF